MKTVAIFLSFIVFSCNPVKKFKEVEEEIASSNIEVTNKIEALDSIAEFSDFNDDTAVTLPIQTKKNTYLLSSILKELHLRGLVYEEEGQYKFQLPFDLHDFDCSAPDCYTSLVSFEIEATNPLAFPEFISVEIQGKGCMPKQLIENSVFNLAQQSEDYVNYYSSDLKSNLIIGAEKRELYYFPNTTKDEINVDFLDEIFTDILDNLESSEIIPYRCSRMMSTILLK